MHTQTTIIRIPIDKLIAHPENPNRMSKPTFEKLKQHISQTKNYEPIIVRSHPSVENCFEIINGHHRVKALSQIGQTFADCIEWQLDDDAARILLATLNRLGGKDQLAEKISLIKNLSNKYDSKQLAKLLPDTKATIEKLKDISKPIDIAAENPKLFLNSLVFFLNDEQIKIVETALEKTGTADGGKAERTAKALTKICQNYTANT